MAAKVGKKPPPVSSEELTPFKSLLFASSAKALKPDGLTKDLLPQIQTLVSQRHLKSMSSMAGPYNDSNVYWAFFAYVEERPPSWARDSSVRDVSNHIVVACRGKEKAKNYVALFFSDTAVRDKASDKISRHKGSLGKLATIPGPIMNAAYVRGQTVTLWMSGTHRRVATKVDSKVISGTDLQYALDPLGDQSYFFTAARSRPAGGKIEGAIGSSPRKSRIWLGPSADWDDFSKDVGQLFEMLVSVTAPVANPLPILAEPLTDPAALPAVQDAYDIALIPPELIDPSDASPATHELRGRLEQVTLQAQAPNGANLSVRAEHPVGTQIGSLDLTFSITSEGKATWVAGNEGDAGTEPDLFGDVVDALQHRRSWLKVWYDSGHTLADEQFWEGRFRDQPFLEFHWENFAGFDVSKEKPVPHATVGTIGTQNSLFCWVKNRWVVPGSGIPIGHGWLACDDGSMEKADFLHIDTVNGIPTLSLIHVKGSGSREVGRGISVSDYEIVTGQAVKNLRWADQAVLAGDLAGKLAGRISDRVWHDSAPAAAPGFLDAVAALGANYNRNVVILQPRVRRTVVDAARVAAAGAAYKRLQQLDILLLAARASVISLNAKLYVIGEDA
jgi:hypothetical protein